MEEVKKQGTESLFVPYKIALELKELGFDEPCFGYRDGCGYLMIKSIPHCVISAPTFSQAFRFFDDKTGYKGFIVPSIKEECFDWEIYHDGNKILECDEYYSLRENAELECLKKLIEIAKEQNVK